MSRRFEPLDKSLALVMQANGNLKLAELTLRRQVEAARRPGEPSIRGCFCLTGALADHFQEATWRGIDDRLRPDADRGDRFVAARD
jgi:hypothetical protein